MTELEIVLNGIEEVEKCGLVCGVDGTHCHHFPDSLISDIKNLLIKQEEKDEKILTALDGYRMCDEMSKNAYENLTKLIQSKQGEWE